MKLDYARPKLERPTGRAMEILIGAVAVPTVVLLGVVLLAGLMLVMAGH